MKLSDEYIGHLVEHDISLKMRYIFPTPNNVVYHPVKKASRRYEILLVSREHVAHRKRSIHSQELAVGLCASLDS